MEVGDLITVGDGPPCIVLDDRRTQALQHSHEPVVYVFMFGWTRAYIWFVGELVSSEPNKPYGNYWTNKWRLAVVTDGQGRPWDSASDDTPVHQVLFEGPLAIRSRFSESKG